LNAAIALFLSGVLAASVGQVLMKKGALRSRDRSILSSFLDPWVIAGYVLMLGTTVVSTLALRVLPLARIVSLQPLGYVIVVVLSVSVLHERMKRHHVVGMLIILAGIVVFNLKTP
jgi:small multidrug resistance pump